MASSIVALVLGVMPIGAGALDTTAPQILENPDRFDTHTVTVQGTVTRLDPRTSRKGNAYPRGAPHLPQSDRCRHGRVPVSGQARSA